MEAVYPCSHLFLVNARLLIRSMLTSPVGPKGTFRRQRVTPSLVVTAYDQSGVPMGRLGT